MTDIPIDGSKIVSSVITSLIKDSFKSVSDGLSSQMRAAWTKVFEDFEPYMAMAHQRNRHVRILCCKDQDVDLYDVYVPTNFQGPEHLSDEDLIQRIRDDNNFVINGNGGAGKTFFMRHLWLTLFKNPAGKTPIFIDLRQLNDLQTVDLEAFIRNSISTKGQLDSDLFGYFCNNGRFVFILDGFDEVNKNKRDTVQKQILNMSDKWPRCSIVVSSRHDSRFAGWQNFSCYNSAPFELNQVKELIGNVPFDPTSKRLFLRTLKEDFFSENESFLSNPLLAIMMLMTFRENMETPKRMNIFYDQCFTTLYQWHDATKAYSRPKTMDIDQFQRSFGVFCLLSYHNQQYEFTKSEIIDYIIKSNRINQFDLNPEEALKDYEESVNMMRQEGLNYVFIHRSFQEYFCAFALIRVVPDKFKQLLPGITSRPDDNVLIMCFEMNKDIVIDNYIAAKLATLRSEGSVPPSNFGPMKFLERLSVTYTLAIQKPSDNPSRVYGIGVSIDPEFHSFVETGRRLMVSELYKWETSLHPTLYHNSIFQLFMKSAGLVGKSSQVCIDFPNGKPTVRWENEAATPKNGDKVLTRMQRELDTKSKPFLEVENHLRELTTQVVAWGDAEVADSQKRGDSLNQILGL